MNDLATIYDLDWYRNDFRDLEGEFDAAGQVLAEMFNPVTAIDVGCGPGMLVRSLIARGVHAIGFDGSENAIEYARERWGHEGPLWCEDLRTMDRLELAYDLVICTEVAEHVEAEHAPHLVNLLTGSGSRRIVLTAAPPGQDGHHHVNCQPAGYWVGLFEAYGYRLASEETIALAEAWGAVLQRISHMPRNVLVFRR